jgi:hypothetical protein
MIEEYDQTKIEDLRGRNDVTLEINFSSNPDLKETVKIEIGGKEAIIPIKYLYSFVFMVANSEQQERLMPVRQTLVRKIVKQHRILAKRDIKKGEYVVARCETNVPVEIWEGLKGMLEKRKSAVSFGAYKVPLLGKK